MTYHVVQYPGNRYNSISYSRMGIIVFFYAVALRKPLWFHFLCSGAFSKIFNPISSVAFQMKMCISLFIDHSIPKYMRMVLSMIKLMIIPFSGLCNPFLLASFNVYLPFFLVQKLKMVSLSLCSPVYFVIIPLDGG